MLTCIPQSVCSWDYRIDDAAAGPATLTFDYFTEQGGISLGGVDYTVRKHGWLSGKWSLECGTETFAHARKPNVLFRSFEVCSGSLALIVEAHGAFTRSYDILQGGALVGTICTAHSFTRRAFIDCPPSVPELAQLFSFWLVALTWRRAARSNSGGAT